MKSAVSQFLGLTLLVGLISLAIASSAGTRAEATDGTVPNASCSSSTPCLEEDNTSTGSGLKGTSTKGAGVIGTTKGKISKAGVLGQDLQATYTANFGVEGLSTIGTGVFGEGPTGVEGVGSAGGAIRGVYGWSTLNNSQGVVGESAGSPGEGVMGVSDTAGVDAVYADGFGGNLFRGNNSQAHDVFLVDDSGNTSIGGGITANGYIAAGGEVSGLQGDFGAYSVATGIFGEGQNSGVEGINSSSGAAFFANGYGGDFFVANSSGGINVIYMTDAGNIYAKGYYGSTQPRTLQKTSDQRTVETYASQSTQPTLEDVGEAQLVNGTAHVALDAGFASTIDARAGYIVTVTPEGMTHGTLCVTQRTPSGFTVQENMDGRSTVPFSYRLVAKPLGSSSVRLPLASVPAHFGQRYGVKQRPVLRTVPPSPYHAKPKHTLPHLN